MSPDSAGVWGATPEPTSDAAELRRVFNERRFHERSLDPDGDISIVLRQDSHPNRPPNRDDPRCTRSQYVRYYEHGRLVTGAHRYLRPDGSLGGSGLPDPKMVETEDGRVLQWRPEADPGD
jgi:hypothetical protein